MSAHSLRIRCNIVVLDIEHRNRAPSGAREDVPAYAGLDNR
jgi:hypothetical protein